MSVEKVREYLTKYGYIDYCPYGSLHSTGMLECEAPVFSVANKRIIEEGMAICIDAYFKGMEWGSFRMEDNENDIAQGHFKRQCKADILMSYAGMINLVGMQAVGCTTIVISFVMGSQLLNSGAISVGKLIGFYTLSSLVTIRAVDICNNLGTFSKNAGALDKICDILDISEEQDQGAEMDIADTDIVLEKTGVLLEPEIRVIE